MLSVSEARRKILESITPLGVEQMATHRACSYILSQNVVADRPLPPFDRVAMDGYAVRSADYTSPTARLEVIGQIPAGVATTLRVNGGV